MDYVLDQGAGAGLRLGMIVLATDESLEYEARQVMAARDVGLMHTRIPSQEDVTPETLQLMAASMTESARLLPDDLCAIAYGCTSAATMIGPEEVARLVQVAHPGVPVTNPMSAVIAALTVLGARRIALVTPYVPEVSDPMRTYLAGHGIEVISEISFDQKNDRTVARIAESSTYEAILKAGRTDGVEAVFTSCTNLRSFGVIDMAEDKLGVPVVSSNQALIWHMLRLTATDSAGWGPGRLFRDHGALETGAQK